MNFTNIYWQKADVQISRDWVFQGAEDWNH